MVLASSQPRCRINTTYCIYSKLPPDDENLIYSKHVEDDYWYKLREKNMHLVGPYYANISRCTVHRISNNHYISDVKFRSWCLEPNTSCLLVDDKKIIIQIVIYSTSWETQNTPINIRSFVSTILVRESLWNSDLKCSQNMLDPATF